ncbi:MAG: hypothetical protein SRB2_00150 [Desulfobacteraceae bacterium Eth-SRB2]|nr:MAG: hypothetical protein SRB2_00150 [Desulfobacteraceae bacterium Eth-SRB2]
MENVCRSSTIISKGIGEVIDEANKTGIVILKEEWGKASKGYTKIEQPVFKENI